VLEVYIIRYVFAFLIDKLLMLTVVASLV